MTSAKTAVFIDTNIIVRANVATAPFHEESLTAIQKLRDNEVALWLSRQVLREYIATVSRDQTFAKALLPSMITERIQYFESNFQIADERSQTTAQLLKLISTVPTGGKQIHDANIVATMLVYGINDLLTLNVEDFRRFSAYINILSLEDIAKLL